MPPRTRLRPEQRRAQLIDVASRLFAADGYDSVSLDDVATEAGCSRQLVYHYFPAKRELLRSLIDSLYVDLIALTAPDLDLPALQRLDAVLDRYLDYVAEKPDGYRAVIEAAQAGDPDVRAAAEVVFDKQLERILASLPAAAVTPAVVLSVRAWLSFVRTAFVAWLDDGRRLPREELRTLVAGALVGAITASGVPVPTE